jgi:CBS domain containing-hemolysin-like protein
MGAEAGSVEADERKMIENIFMLDDITAEDTMTQTTDMVALNSTYTIRELSHIVTETGFSRFPVYTGNIDHIDGILYAKDLMAALLKDPQQANKLKIKDLVRPAIFVPEQKRLDILMREFQQEKKHVAIVVNEYGETRGLITLEDILEEIVGDINDEGDRSDASIHKINSKTIIVNADVDVGDIEEVLNVELHEESHKTIAWVILNELGRVPEKGDEFTLKNVKIIIMEAEETKIKRVKLIKIR